jgi:hypothetical protein
MSATIALFAPLAPEELAAIAAPAKAATPIVPAPADAPPMRFRHPELREPTRVWRYHDAKDRLCGYACRWDFLDEHGKPDKVVLPVTFCDLGADRRAWRAKGLPAPRPLLRLPELRARPASWVLVCEGEKAADAAAQLFPDMVATTPMHGAKSPHLSDWGPCAGRTVVISPDADEAGHQFGDAACALARTAGAAQVLCLEPRRLGAWIWRGVARSGPPPDGWDLADAVTVGWTAKAVAACRAEPGFFVDYPDPAAGALAQPDSAGHTGRFRIEPDGSPSARRRQGRHLFVGVAVFAPCRDRRDTRCGWRGLGAPAADHRP